MIEPDREFRRDQWSVHIGEDGAPEFTPPARLQRFAERSRPPDDPVVADSVEAEGGVDQAFEVALL